MGDQGYLKRLDVDLKRWAHEGWIADDVATRLAEDARAHAAPVRQGHLLAGLAGGIVAVGVLTIIAANWSAMTNATRLLIAFSVIALTILTAGELRARGRLLAGDIAAALGVAFWGGGLVVVGQAFHAGATTAGFLAVWSLGAGVIALAVRSVLGACVGAALALGWLITAIAAADVSFGLFGLNRDGPLTHPNAAAIALFALGGLATWWRSRAIAHFAVFGLIIYAGWAMDRTLFDAVGLPEGRVRAWVFAGVALAIGAIGEAAWRSRMVWGARLASGWMAWTFAATVFGAVSSGAFRSSDPTTYGWFSLGLLLAAAIVAYGAAPGRRWIQGAGVVMFIAHGALLAFAADDLLIGGATMIGLGTILWLVIAFAPRVHALAHAALQRASRGGDPS